jgi:hypothetical protein
MPRRTGDISGAPTVRGSSQYCGAGVMIQIARKQRTRPMNVV